MKQEWRKQEKGVYKVTPNPRIVEVSRQQFIMLTGKGNPNDLDFSRKVSALYTLTYGIKKIYKEKAKWNTIHDFVVYPLEGIWQAHPQDSMYEINKDQLEYTIMIRQPDFITKEMVLSALQRVKTVKPNPLWETISFDSMVDGLCVEMLHKGSYDKECVSFQKMDKLAQENHLIRLDPWHREIYLHSANRVSEDAYKTILRYRVKKENE